VAVDGRQWYQSIHWSKARRMVPLAMWQWQYWRSCDGLNIHEKKMAVAVAVADFGASCGPMSGSGGVAVVPVDS
jgi:hypothetical protein